MPGRLVADNAVGAWRFGRVVFLVGVAGKTVLILGQVLRVIFGFDIAEILAVITGETGCQEKA